MPCHRRRDAMFLYRRHGEEIIVLAVPLVSSRLSLRDLAEMLAERGFEVYPSTIWRWVQRFVPEFERSASV
jgi:IS6 family transposase